MTKKQQPIFERITELQDRLEDFKCEMTLLYGACEALKRERDDLKEFAYERVPKLAADQMANLKQERDAAIERAEKAERELAEQKERARVGRLHAMETKTRLHGALKQIIQIEANPFPGDSTWRDLTLEAIKIARAALSPSGEKGGDQDNIFLSALEEYANPDNWSFYHTKLGHIRWVTKLGPDLAIEALDPNTMKESSEEKEAANALL